MPGLASILRLLGGVDPMSARTPPFLPQGAPAPDYSTGPPPPIPPEVRRPGARAALLGALPGILRGAAVGIATPTTGSSAMDAARAFLASGDDRDATAMRQMQIQRQQAQDEMERRKFEEDMQMQPYRRRLMESQVSENEAQAAYNQKRRNESPTADADASIAGLQRWVDGMTQVLGRKPTELEILSGPFAKVFQQIPHQRQPSPPASAQAYWAGRAFSEKDPAKRSEYESKMAPAERFIPRPMAPRIVTAPGNGTFMVDQDESGNPRSRPVPGLSIPAARNAGVGRATGGPRPMTAGQQHKVSIEQAASQAVLEAEDWLSKNPRQNVNPYDLAISNLKKYFANDPRVRDNYADVVARIRQLQGKMAQPKAKSGATESGADIVNQMSGSSPAPTPAGSGQKKNPFRR